MQVKLNHSGIEFVVEPDNGGAWRSLRVQDYPVLYEAAAQPAFWMVPFAGRVRDGRFSTDDVSVQLARNTAEHQHPIHGYAWQQKWVVTTVQPTLLQCETTYAPGEWPWPFRLRVRYRLEHTTLECTVQVTNTGTRPMPCMLGLHPFFNAADPVLLTARCKGIFDMDTDAIPVRERTLPGGFNAGGALRVNRTGHDQVLSGWSRHASILFQSAGLTAEVFGSRVFRHLILYAPQSAEFVCIEPISDPPDAFNTRPHSVRTLPPGGKLDATLRIAFAAGSRSG